MSLTQPMIDEATTRNICVYDSEAACGHFSSRLISLMNIVMRRACGKGPHYFIIDDPKLDSIDSSLPPGKAKRFIAVTDDGISFLGAY